MGSESAHTGETVEVATVTVKTPPAPPPKTAPNAPQTAPPPDPYATLYAHLESEFLAAQARITAIQVVSVDPNGKGGVVQIVGKTAQDVRYAGHVLAHETEASNWDWLGDGLLVDEQMCFAHLRCHQFSASA